MELITRSSKHYLKDTNEGKITLLDNMLSSVKVVVNVYIKMMLSDELPIKNQLSSSKLPSVGDFNGGQWKQVAYAHASAIIRSNYKQAKNRVYSRYKKVYRYFKEKNRQLSFLDTRYKDLKINIKKRMKFDLDNFSLHLDERICNVQKGNSFDNFVQIKTPFIVEGKKCERVSVNIPVKEHKHSLKYKEWDRVKTIRLSKDSKGRLYICFVYQRPIEYKTEGKSIAFDIGYKKMLSCSDGNHYGTHMNAIYDKLANKKRGSVNYTQLLQHKRNEINRVINNIDFSSYMELYVEDLHNVKYKSKFSNKFNNKLQYWTFSSILQKLDMIGDEKGFLVTKVDPAYTSQICSSCGVVDKSNREGEIYHCSSCGSLIDADTNAAINILRRGVYSPSGKQN